MLSLQKRLGSGLLISLALVFLALWLITRTAIEHLAEDYIASRLTHDSETLLAALQIDQAGHMQLDTARVKDSIYQRPFSGHYFQISGPQNTLRSRSLWDQELSVPEIHSGEAVRRHVQGPQQQHLLQQVHGYRKQGIAIRIAVAEDLTQLDTDIAVFQRYFALTAGAMLLLLIVLQIMTLRSGLRPLHRVTRQLRELEQGRRGLLEADVPAEIVPLVEEINRLVNSNIQRLARSRNAMADLAHALKRPLTVIQQHVQEHGTGLPRDFVKSADTQIQEMRQVIEHILKRARLAGSGPAAVHFDPVTDVQDLIGSLQQMYFDRHLAITYSPNLTEPLALDRQDMLELLGNLLDNACKWAGQHVRLAISRNTDLQITVDDDGPGISEADQAELLTRGKRLDETIEGQGLGLAIVKDIVDQYQGTIAFSRSDSLGGLRITVRLSV